MNRFVGLLMFLLAGNAFSLEVINKPVKVIMGDASIVEGSLQAEFGACEASGKSIQIFKCVLISGSKIVISGRQLDVRFDKAVKTLHKLDDVRNVVEYTLTGHETNTGSKVPLYLRFSVVGGEFKAGKLATTRGQTWTVAFM